MATRKPRQTPSAEETEAASPESPESTESTVIANGVSVSDLLGPLKIEFLTDSASPFSDKYSVDAEGAFLAEYIAAGADEDDPLYDRYVEWIERRDQLRRMKEEHKSHMGADALVPRGEAAGMRTLGRLVGEEEDSMEIHTKEAYRMFMGRRPEPGTLARPVIGGKRAGSVLRSLWNMTSRDNPYADWALVRHEHSIAEVAARLEREIEAAHELFAQQRKRGLNLSVMRSENPVKQALGFASPYGFATVSIINRFDYFVRLSKTLEHKALHSKDEVRRSINEVTRLIRRVWQDTSRFDRALSHEEVAALSRSDFLEGADEMAGKRVEYARQCFGVVPVQIFTCAIAPRHSRRNRYDTPQERALLQSVGAKLAQLEISEAAAMARAETEAVASGDQALPGGAPEAEAGAAVQAAD